MTSEGLNVSKWKDGLPPVGEVCEIEYSAGLWVMGECVAHHRDGAVIEYKERYSHCFTDRVRPLKSEAERKRDEAVEAFALQVIYCYEPEIEPLDATPYKRMAEKLHDAGYRKITPLTDEQIDDCTCCDLALYDSRSLAAGAKWARSHILGEES